MRRRILVAMIAGAAVLLLASVSQPTAAYRVVSAAPPPPRVTVIGDSVATAILYDKGAQAILGQGVDLRLELAPCRRVAEESCPYDGARAPNVIELVETLGKALGSTVIVSVGYNDYQDLYAANIEDALAALRAAGVQRVIWVALRATRTSYMAMNDTIDAAARRHPEMTVADWNLYSRSHPDWFWEDGLHLKGEGSRAMASLLHKRLVALGIPLPDPLEIDTRALPQALTGKGYGTQLAAHGGRKPYRWTRAPSLPSWLRLTADGRLSGKAPARIGKVSIVVRVTDATGTAASRRLTLRIGSRSTANAGAVPTAMAGSAVTYPPRVTMITDSVGGVLFWASSERERLAQGLDFRLETKACRKLVSPGCYAYEEVPPSVFETVERLFGELGHLVIVDVGYNDFADGYADGIDTVMGRLAAAGVERVVWVTLHEYQQTWAQINDQIRAATMRWPQLTVADWAPVAAREPSWFVDGAHMNYLGAVGFVTFLRPVILEACGNACVPPEATATMLAAVVRRGQVTLRWSGNSFARTYDIALRRTGEAWRTVVTRLALNTYRPAGWRARECRPASVPATIPACRAPGRSRSRFTSEPTRGAERRTTLTGSSGDTTLTTTVKAGLLAAAVGGSDARHGYARR